MRYHQNQRINSWKCDTLSLEEQTVQIEAFPLPPSMIVRTKKSLHCYWLTKDAKLEDFRRVQKRLVAQFGGDPACINESRVFRLPGFYHCKADPVMVECVKFNPELRYTQSELEAHLPQIPVSRRPRHLCRKETAKGCCWWANGVLLFSTARKKPNRSQKISGMP